MCQKRLLFVQNQHKALLNHLLFYSWTGKIHWGYNINDKKYTNIPPTLGKNGKIVLSCNEPSDLIDRLKPHYDCVTAGGAGYKSLCVCLGLVDLYVSSRPSTYNWDTCAGNLFTYSRSSHAQQLI